MTAGDGETGATPSGPEFEAGLELRREMFGEAAIGNALAPGFKAPLEAMVTRYCFGDIWQRPPLDRRTRSLLTIGLLAMLAKPVQLKAHVRGAIANGATAEEIREVLLHVMVYGGVAAAADATNNAAEVLDEMGLG